MSTTEGLLHPSRAARTARRHRLATIASIAFLVAVAVLNIVAWLAAAPSVIAHEIGEALTASPIASALIVQNPWREAVAVALLALAWGLMRRRPAAWTAAVGIATGMGLGALMHREPGFEIAAPLFGAALLIAARRSLIGGAYGPAFRRRLAGSPDSVARAASIVRAHGQDTLAPFKARPDVGHLFARSGDGVLAFRVENRSLIVAADPVGTPDGIADVVKQAQGIARGAGLRFGIEAASEPMARALERDFGMKSLYLGCEAVVDPAGFRLDVPGIKKVRQAHRRVQREGYALDCVRLGDLAPEDRAALEQCHAAGRGDITEQSFAMAPERLDAPALQHAIVMRAVHEETGQVGGAIVFVPVGQGQLWSLALQARNPDAPNGVIDALIVHALQEAKAQGVERVSLNFASARRYLHEPVQGFWPHLARLLARLATRWTQIDDLRSHNEKFSPTWEPRYLVVDHLLHVPHLVLAVIWQEGQLPRPSMVLAPAWPTHAPEATAGHGVPERDALPARA